MTLRAVILGLVGAVFVAAYTHFNDFVLQQTLFIGNHLPYSVYGGLIVFVVILNPLLLRLHKRLAFTGKELAVALTLTLAACVVPGSGLMTTFTTSLMMPHHINRMEAGWRSAEVIDRVPPKMLADISEDEDKRLGGYVQGLSVGTKSIGLSDIPWGAWTRTLILWLPIILALWIAVIALSVVVHRQWSDHEQLPYPIARFAEALLPAKGQARGSIFTNRYFLIGLTVVLVLHLNNYGQRWFPSMIRIPTVFNFGSLQEVAPTLQKGGAWWFFYPRLYFTPIAFAYFLSTSVSFSLGIGTVLFAYITGVLAGYGVVLRGGGWFEPSYQKLLTSGAYIGLLGTTIYTGRYYYYNVLRRAIGLESRDEIQQQTVWAGRVFLAGLFFFVAQLIALGLDWQISLFYGVMAIGIFLVMGRISAETGMFFIQPLWAPCVLLVGLFGVTAFGPTTMAIMFLVSTVLLIDPREALMPFIVNGLKILDLKKVKVGKPAILAGGAIIIALAVAIPATLYYQYNQASHMHDNWTSFVFPRAAFDEVARTTIKLKATGQLEETEARSGFGRLGGVSLDGLKWFAFALGVVLVVGVSLMRWRLPWWPIHPIMFLTWHPSAPNSMFFSLLVGCLIKWLVMKYGGERLYQKGKPLMFGLIAGDMLGGVVPSIIGFIYYSITGEIPEAFQVTPG